MSESKIKIGEKEKDLNSFVNKTIPKSKNRLNFRSLAEIHKIRNSFVKTMKDEAEVKEES